VFFRAVQPWVPELSFSRSDVVAMKSGPEVRARRALVGGAIALIAGLGLVGTTRTEVGPALLLGGWVVLGYGIHSFGRRGSDRPDPTNQAPAR
jgi:hypothetical protein